MFYPVGVAIGADAAFTNGGLGATGLTVTCDVYDHADTKVVTAGACTEIGGGLYRYTLTSNLNTGLGRYRFVFKTSGTADRQHQFAEVFTVAWLTAAGGTVLAASQGTVTMNLTGNLSGSVGSV